MNKEYIDREALIAEYDRVHKGPPGGARKLMVNAPKVDAVEVVRCEDCKHYNGHRFCRRTKTTVLDKDFCSYGEQYVAKKCKYCDRPLTESDMDQKKLVCGNCSAKKAMIVRFIEECNEFKKTINYDSILRQREEKRT
jgi:hypothetical protein